MPTILNAPHDNCMYGSMTMTFRAPLHQHYNNTAMAIELENRITDKLLRSMGCMELPHLRRVPPMHIEHKTYNVIRLEHVMLNPMEICNVVCSAMTFDASIENDVLSLTFIYGGWYLDLDRLDKLPHKKKLTPKGLQYRLARMWKQEMLAQGMLEYLDMLFDAHNLVEMVPVRPVPCIVLDANNNTNMQTSVPIHFVDCKVKTHYLSPDSNLTLIHTPGLDACSDIMRWFMPLYYDNPEERGYEYDDETDSWLPQDFDSDTDNDVLTFFMHYAAEHRG